MALNPDRPDRFAVARSIVVDLTMLSGASLLVYGSWAAYWPAGFIVGGLVLLGAGVSGAKTR